MEQELIPAMILSAKQIKKLRCWSAGCSSGEEAYTVAIILRETLGDKGFLSLFKSKWLPKFTNSTQWALVKNCIYQKK